MIEHRRSQKPCSGVFCEIRNRFPLLTNDDSDLFEISLLEKKTQ